MMKKRVLTLSLMAAVVLSMTACGTTNTNSDTENTATDESANSESTDLSAESESSDENDALFAQINEANDLDYILENYGSLTLSYEYIQNDATCTAYFSKDSFIDIDSTGYVLVAEDQIYGRNSEDAGDYFKIKCFSDSDYQTFKDTYEAVPWYTSNLPHDNAQVKEEDSTLIVTINQDFSDDEKTSTAETYDLKADDIKGYEIRLEVDPDTMLIQRFVYSIDCGSTGVLIMDVTSSFDQDKPEVPSEMNDFLNATDVRTVTMITDPGTEEEKTTEDTIRKGCAYLVIANDYDIYTDEDCTTEYDGTGDLTQDLTLYLKAK